MKVEGYESYWDMYVVMDVVEYGISSCILFVGDVDVYYVIVVEN